MGGDTLRACLHDLMRKNANLWLKSRNFLSHCLMQVTDFPPLVIGRDLICAIANMATQCISVGLGLLLTSYADRGTNSGVNVLFFNRDSDAT